MSILKGVVGGRQVLALVPSDGGPPPAVSTLERLRRSRRIMEDFVAARQDAALAGDQAVLAELSQVGRVYNRTLEADLRAAGGPLDLDAVARESMRKAFIWAGLNPPARRRAPTLDAVMPPVREMLAGVLSALERLPDGPRQVICARLADPAEREWVCSLVATSAVLAARDWDRSREHC